MGYKIFEPGRRLDFAHVGSQNKISNLVAGLQETQSPLNPLLSTTFSPLPSDQGSIPFGSGAGGAASDIPTPSSISNDRHYPVDHPIKACINAISRPCCKEETKIVVNSCCNVDTGISAQSVTPPPSRAGIQNAYSSVVYGAKPPLWEEVGKFPEESILRFVGINSRTGERQVEISTATRMIDGSVTVVVRNESAGTEKARTRFLPLPQGGWVPDLPEDKISEAVGMSPAIPASMPLDGLNLGAWVGVTTGSLLKNKIQGYLDKLREMGRYPNFGVGSTGSTWTRTRSFGTGTQGQMSSGDPEKELSVQTHTHTQEECKICHDMECTKSPDVFEWGICNPIRVDISSCCVDHDIELWCGRLMTTAELVTLGMLRFAAELSVELGLCILGKFLGSATNNKWYCGGALVALPWAAYYGAIVAGTYTAITFFAQLIGILHPLIHFGGEVSHCCLCKGTDPTVCCERRPGYCSSSNGTLRDLCSEECDQCRYGCRYSIGNVGVASMLTPPVQRVLDKDPNMDCCYKTPKPIGHCPRYAPRMKSWQRDEWIREGKIVVEPNGAITIYDPEILALGGIL